jgi:hypothetical protein
MSPFTEIKTQIRDIEALRLACQEIGLSLVPNAQARGYYENITKGDYVIQLKGPYDIALNKQADGTYGPDCGSLAGSRRKGGGPGIRQTPPALWRPQSHVGGQEEGIVCASPLTTERCH